MPVKKIFSLTFCALLLLASAVSAQGNDARDTSSLQRAALEGFGARLTIELPPLEYCQLGRFSTKSEGNDFGFVGNTALPPRGQDTIYIGISSEETAAFSERGTVANRLSEYAHNLIAGELSSRTVPCRIDREYFLPQDGHPAWLITLAYENRPVRRSVFIIADEGRLWRVNALHHAQTPAQNTRMDAILTSIKLGRSDAAKPRVRFDGIQPIEFTERADTHGDASSHALSTTTIRDRGSALTMQLPPSGTPFAISTPPAGGTMFTHGSFVDGGAPLELSALLIHLPDAPATQKRMTAEQRLEEAAAVFTKGAQTAAQGGTKKILRNQPLTQNGCPARRLTVQTSFNGHEFITEALFIARRDDIWIAELSFRTDHTDIASRADEMLSTATLSHASARGIGARP